jgi:hypothetical protein
MNRPTKRRFPWLAVCSPNREDDISIAYGFSSRADNSYRARFRSGEIRVLDPTGKLERTIAFGEVDRKL